MTPHAPTPGAAGRHGVRRPLGGSGVAVSQLSLGTAPLGGLFRPVADDAALATVGHALDRGMVYLDTAPMYGAGRAEARLGHALRGVPRDRFVVSTKVGRVLEDGPDVPPTVFADTPPGRREVFDFSADGVRRSLEASLERLGLDGVDVVYLHDPDDHARQAMAEAFPALAAWRDQGVVRAIGVGMNHTGLLARFVRETDLDVVLVAGRYTLLDRTAERDVLPAARAAGVSVVVGGALNSGILADPRAGATFDYLPADPALVDRAARMQRAAARFGVGLAAAALQFPLRDEAVASVLVGCRDEREVEHDVASFDLPIPPECWAAIEDERAA